MLVGCLLGKARVAKGQRIALVATLGETGLAVKQGAREPSASRAVREPGTAHARRPVRQLGMGTVSGFGEFLPMGFVLAQVRHRWIVRQIALATPLFRRGTGLSSGCAIFLDQGTGASMEHATPFRPATGDVTEHANPRVRGTAVPRARAIDPERRNAYLESDLDSPCPGWAPRRRIAAEAAPWDGASAGVGARSPSLVGVDTHLPRGGEDEGAPDGRTRFLGGPVLSHGRCRGCGSQTRWTVVPFPPRSGHPAVSATGVASSLLHSSRVADARSL